MSTKLKNIIVVCSAALLLFGTFFVCIFKPNTEFSESERRQLAKFPQITIDNILSGKFMKEFEEYTLDQFPLRDQFRTMKAFSAFYVFNQQDNNKVYIENGYASKVEYPLNENSIKNAGEKFKFLYDKYLAPYGSNVYLSVIPDKNYFMAEESGHLALDYDEFMEKLLAEVPYMNYIDIFDLLKLEDYYKTDTHWRSENILDVAKHIASSMGVELTDEYETVKLDNKFYGVYYGQSALPLPSETIYYPMNETFSDMVIYDHENSKNIGMYDMDKAYGNDPYEMFLSGPISLITIENPNATTDKELIIFRDSFGSSIAPYFAEAYSKITLIDIRYLMSGILDKFVEFNGQDVLFLYSTLVLNNSETFK